MIRRIAFALTALLGLAVAADDKAHAQALNAFSPISQASLSVTTSSARTALATPIGPTALVVNTGSNTAYVRLGNAAVTAATTDTFLGAGCAFAFSSNGQTYVSAITASSTTTLAITTGGGIPTLPNSGCAVSGGGGGVTSIAGTANQITASAATGAVTLSIPSDFRLPGTINLLTLTQPATAATLTLANNSSLITAGAFATTLTSSATTNSTLPAGTHSLAPLDSPSFTTPSLGVATATSGAFGGCTIGANVVCATGAVGLTGRVTWASGGGTVWLDPSASTYALAFGGDTGSNYGGMLRSGGVTLSVGGVLNWTATSNLTGATVATLAYLGTANLRQGSVPSATPIAQIFTLGEASIAGTSNNVGGSNGTIQCGLGTGTGTPCQLLFQTAAVTGSGTGAQSYATAMSITGAGAISMPLLATSSAAQTGTVCSGTGGLLTVDTTTTCLLSAKKFKEKIEPLDAGLAEVMRLRPVSYNLKPEFNPTKLGRQIGLIADEVQDVDPRLVGLDAKGEPHGMRYEQLTAVLVKAIQEQQGQIAELKARLDTANDNHIIKAALR